MKVRLAVDLIACDGRGLCAELLPELITLDDWGYPMLTRREVPPALREEAAAAVQLCPKLALRLETLRLEKGRLEKPRLEAGEAGRAS